MPSDYSFDAVSEVDMNLVMNDDGDFIELQGSGEESTFSQDQLDSMLDLGKEGIRQLLDIQQQALA